MADPLFVLLVSGDPEGHDDGFARCAWLRVAELVGLFWRDRALPTAVVKADTVLRFVHFDCHTSTVGVYEHDFAKDEKVVSDPTAKQVQRNWVTLDASFQTKHPPLDTAKDPKIFVKWLAIAATKAIGIREALSIVDVYRSVREAPRGSVLELSIFSHAFVEGPVLYAGTSATPGSTRRTPGDTDGRAAVDFQADMGEDGAANTKALEEFRGAFAPTGRFRIWGCNIQDVVDTVPPEGGPARRCLIMSTVREITNAAFTRQLRMGGTVAAKLRADALPAGSLSLTLDIDHEIGHERELQTDAGAGHGLTPFTPDRLFEIRYHENQAGHAYQSFFNNESDGHGGFAKVITRSLSDVVKFVANETTPSYVFKAAEALQTVTVVGGAPGTSAEIPKGGQQFIPDARLPQAKFFSKFFSVSLNDPNPGALGQPNYARIDAKAVQTILDRAAHGLP